MTRKFTFLLMALLALAGFKSWGQNETITVDFNSGMPEDWTLIDHDGDNHNWFRYTASGSPSLTSESWSGVGGSLNPDNLFVSPKITLGAGAKITFNAKSTMARYPEHIGVAVFTDEISFDDAHLSMAYDETLTTAEYKQISANLDDYAGKQVYVAIRHYNCPDNYQVYIDDITIDLGETSQKYTVNLTQPEAGGTIDATPKTDVAAGTTVTLSANPAFGYEFGTWTVVDADGQTVELLTNNTFEMPESNVTVTATFNELTKYAINCDDDLLEGAIHAEYEGMTITEAPAGAEVTLVAEPFEGYALDHFTVNDVISDNTFVMPAAPVSVSAVFKRVYSVNSIAVGGTISHNSTTPGETEYAEGTYVYLSAQADEDHTFVESSFLVFSDDEPYSDIPVDYSSGIPYFIMPASNVTVTAEFEAIDFHTVYSNADPYFGGTFNISKENRILEGEQIVISNIQAEDGYRFKSVEVICLDGEDTPVTTYSWYGDYLFNMPDYDVFVTVIFEEIPKYSVTVDDEIINGSVSVIDYSYEYTFMEGETVYLEVAPDYYYVLVNITATPDEGQAITPVWSHDNTYTFTMPASPVVITASFRQLESYTINYYVNGQIDRTMQCMEDEPVNIDAPEDPWLIPGGVSFEGWGVSEIDTYVTEKPALVGNYELPTRDYDLYAVLRYSETLPAPSKDGDKWVKVSNASELNNNDLVIFADDQNKKVMTHRSGAFSGDFNAATVTISDGEITTLPSNAVIFTALTNDLTIWQFSFNDASSGPSTLANYGGEYLVPVCVWGGCDTWTVGEDGKVKDTEYFKYVANDGNSFKVKNGTTSTLYKKYNPTITTNFYMTELLYQSNFIDDAYAKNIIIPENTFINVRGRLELAENGLFRNNNSLDPSSFVFFENSQFYYKGNETIKARRLMTINGYGESKQDGYYLIANPTDNPEVENINNTYCDFDLYTFDPAQEKEWRNHKLIEDYDILRGTGYLYANKLEQFYFFDGNFLPAGSQEFYLTLAEAGDGIDFPGFNLIGNPFACNAYPIDEDGDFLSFYKMNEAGSELELVENIEAVAPCQGLFVEAAENNQKIHLTTEAPVTVPSMLSLTVSQNRGNAIDRAIVRFDGANDLHKFMLNPDHTNIRLAKHGEEFAAISSEAEGEIPVSFKAEKNGSYTITVNTENVNAHYIHLIDNKTGMDVDLLATPSYTFNASTSDYAYRFKLVFSMTGVEENGSNANSYAYISNGNLVIDHIEGEATMQIVDMLGRVVSTEIVSGSYNKALNLKAGLYIINLNGMTQKIVVK